jgi:hypothetical protein
MNREWHVVQLLLFLIVAATTEGDALDMRSERL